MKNVQAPQFLQNLYRDLRDRRLLVPAAVLLVALIAVPMALPSSSATAPPPPAPVTTEGSQEEVATSPAVLTEELGVTDYRKRLEQLQNKNPFERQYVDAPPETGSSSSSGSTTSGSTDADTSSSTATTSTSTDTSTISETPSTATSGSPGSTGSPEVPSVTLFVFEADLAIGPPGELSRRKHVELGTFLPSDSKPMLAFAGAAEDMKHALFMVSDDISSVTGDGRCVPGNDNCRLLELKVGDEAKLAYAPESDRTYKLKLFGIDLTPADANAGKRGKRGKRDSLFALAAQGR